MEAVFNNNRSNSQYAKIAERLLAPAMVLGMIAFSGCGKSKFGAGGGASPSHPSTVTSDDSKEAQAVIPATPTPAPVVDNTAISGSDIDPRCTQSNLESMEVDVDFVAPTAQCDWGMGDNLPMAQGLIQARKEFASDAIDKALKGKVLCELTFKLTAANVKYDDELLVVFSGSSNTADGGSILASSLDFSGRFTKDSNDFYSYSWPQLRGTQIYGGTPLPREYCVGKGLPDSICKIPLSETSGDLEIAIPGGFQSQLTKKAKAKGNSYLHLVVTGDNDPATDCMHNGIKLKAFVKAAKE